jgi:hypothetical protein
MAYEILGDLLIASRIQRRSGLNIIDVINLEAVPEHVPGQQYVESQMVKKKGIDNRWRVYISKQTNSDAVLSSLNWEQISKTDEEILGLLSGTAPIVYDDLTGVISIPVATDLVDGYMSATDNADMERISRKNISNGYPGLTGRAIDQTDTSTGAVVSFLQNNNTIPRTYNFPDRDLTSGQFPPYQVGVPYVAKDIIEYADALYICRTAYTSTSTFALEFSNWERISEGGYATRTLADTASSYLDTWGIETKIGKYSFTCFNTATEEVVLYFNIVLGNLTNKIDIYVKNGDPITEILNEAGTLNVLLDTNKIFIQNNLGYNLELKITYSPYGA